MGKDTLKQCRIAILATDGFEQVELTGPKEKLEQAGAATEVVAPGDKPTITGWNFTDWGDDVGVDVPLRKARPDDYDALVLPGGVLNPDKLRLDEDAIHFVREFAGTGRPIAAICHGPWTLINAGLVDGKRMTSWPSVRVDLENAGAHWVDREVVEDGSLITSRKPDDVPAFVDALVRKLEQGAGAHRSTAAA